MSLVHITIPAQSFVLSEETADFLLQLSLGTTYSLPDSDHSRLLVTELLSKSLAVFDTINDEAYRLTHLGEHVRQAYAAQVLVQML